MDFPFESSHDHQELTPNFEKGGGLIPAIIQDFSTRKVLMLGFFNQESLEQTKATGKVTFFSRTKSRLWTKGETSGNFLFVKEIRIDCDEDALLILVEPVGGVCHTGADTCFNEINEPGLHFLEVLSSIIKDRKEHPTTGSYTSDLFAKGINKIAQKVGEEAIELVIEAKDQNTSLFINEAADLLFHYLILLEAKGHNLTEILQVLKNRHQKS